ncbi:minor capsid protein [Capybara microvirus Cap3_SP_352]|nr:minor capsid protein [Capybara microvirus Cap3_SP_352]
MAFGLDDFLIGTAASSLINGALGMFGTSYQNSANTSLNRETRDWQTSERKAQNAFSEYMWNKSNEYNSPENQRKLLTSAGYNPLYSNGNQFSGAQSLVSGSAPGASSIGMVAPELASILNQSAITTAQVRNLNADAMKKESETDKTLLESEALKISNKFNSDILAARTSSELASLFASEIESKNKSTVATLYFNELENGDLSDSIKDSFYRQNEIVANTAFKLAAEKKQIEGLTDKQSAEVINMGAQILLGYAGLKNGVKIAQIQAAATKYAADKGFDSTKLSVDKTVEGAVINLLKEAGLSVEAIENTINGAASDAGDVVVKGVRGIIRFFKPDAIFDDGNGKFDYPGK